MPKTKRREVVVLPRQRSPNRERAYEIYKEHNGKIENRRIAELLNIPEKTIGGWKCKDKWEEQLKGVLQTEIRSTPKQHGGQPGNKNAVGHKPSVPKGNVNAKKHGLFCKHLPPDALEIFDAIDKQSPIDMLWDSIKVQYTNIILAQAKNSDTENFLQAHSRAVTALNGLIRQYDELLRSELVTEEQRARIDKLKAETARMTESDSEEIGDDGFLEALEGKVNEVWKDWDKEAEGDIPL